MQLKKILLGILLMTTIVVMPAFGQAAYNTDRDAKLFTAQGQTYTIQNRIGALNLTFEYLVSGSPSSLTMTISGCMRGGTCDTLDTYSTASSSNRKISGLYDNYVVTVTTLSGGTSPTIQMNAFYTAASTPSQGSLVAGSQLVDGINAGNFLTYQTALGLSFGLEVLDFGYNGATADRQRTESATNQVNPSKGVQLVSKLQSTAVNSQPAVSNQASASVAAGGAGVIHVIDQVCFSAGSTTAPALTQLSVNIRDGASGAGTVKASFVVIIPAATGQNQPPFCTPQLGIVGTAATAATAEWSALLTNLFEQVTLLYHDIN